MKYLKNNIKIIRVKEGLIKEPKSQKEKQQTQPS